MGLKARSSWESRKSTLTADRLSTEILKEMFNPSEDSQVFWALFLVETEDLPRHLSDSTLEKGALVALQWRVELGI